MNDTERIERLEREVQSLKLAIRQLKSSAAERESVQDAVDDLQNSVQLIFKHVHVPGIVYRPGRRIVV